MLQIDNSFMTVEISTSVPVILEKITLMTTFHDLNMSAAFYLPVDKEKVGSLQLGSISHTANIFPYASSSFYSLPVLTQFIVTISDISLPGITGFQSIEVENFFHEQYEFSIKCIKGH